MAGDPGSWLSVRPPARRINSKGKTLVQRGTEPRMRIRKSLKLGLALCSRCDADHKKTFFTVHLATSNGLVPFREEASPQQFWDRPRAHGREVTGKNCETARRVSTGGRRLRGFPCRTADQALNCFALIADIKSVKELFPVEVEHKQPYGR